MRGTRPGGDEPRTETISLRQGAATAPDAAAVSRQRNDRATVETWVEATWAEHLRNHDRVSVAHRDVEQRARQLTRSGTAIHIRHFIAADPVLATTAAVVAHGPG